MQKLLLVEIDLVLVASLRYCMVFCEGVKMK